MIISLSGSKGSGKDLSGKIIQFLTSHDDDLIQDFLESPEVMLALNKDGKKNWQGDPSCCSEWKIKKFANKLKEMVAVLLDVPTSRMEELDFKETPLPPQWSIWVEGEEDSLFEVSLTPRMFLQIIGTDVCRRLHPNVWVNSLMDSYEENSKWIVTDTRFPNELAAVKAAGGISIYIERETPFEDSHLSETAFEDKSDFDYIIDNNGDLDSLISELTYILSNEGII
jgi:hypothetical protein